MLQSKIVTSAQGSDSRNQLKIVFQPDQTVLICVNLLLIKTCQILYDEQLDVHVNTSSSEPR